MANKFYSKRYHVVHSDRTIYKSNSLKKARAVRSREGGEIIRSYRNTTTGKSIKSGRKSHY